MKPMNPKTTLAQDIKSFSAEADGVFSLAIIQPEDARDLMLDMIAGDLEAARLIQAINRLCSEISGAPANKPMLCAACPNRLKGTSYSFALVLPSQPDPSKLLGFGFCPRCASSRDRLSAKAVTHLRKIWPDMRPVHDGRGHA